MTRSRSSKRVMLPWMPAGKHKTRWRSIDRYFHVLHAFRNGNGAEWNVCPQINWPVVSWSLNHDIFGRIGWSVHLGFVPTTASRFTCFKSTVMPSRVYCGYLGVTTWPARSKLGKACETSLPCVFHSATLTRTSSRLLSSLV